MLKRLSRFLCLATVTGLLSVAGAKVCAEGGVGAATAAAPAAPSARAGTRATAEEMAFVELVNQEREQRGLKPLIVEPLLVDVARDHSAEMRDKAYFNHNSPTSGRKTPMDRYLLACSQRPGYACVGENLYYCSVPDVTRGHKAFMTSPTHRDNVLFPRFEKIGVGIVRNSKGEFWVTQMFLTTTPPADVKSASEAGRG